MTSHDTINLKNLDQIPTIRLASSSTREAAKAAGGTSRDFWNVPRSSLHTMPGFNVRIRTPAYVAHVRWLADQMKAEGFKQDKPLTCYVSKGDSGESLIFVTDGHSRLEGYDLATSEGADLGHIPIVISKEQQTQSIEDLTVGLVTSNSGRPLEPLEKAAVIKRLVNFRWSEGQIAARLGCTSQHVRDMLLLASADPQIRDMIARGDISPTTALSTMKQHGVKAVAVLTEAMCEAKAQGRQKATGRHLVDPMTRIARRHAPILLKTFKSIQNDPGFGNLAPETRSALDELLNQIAESEKSSSKKAAKKSPTEGGPTSQEALDLT